MPNHFHGIIIGAGLVPAREVTATANFYGWVQDSCLNFQLFTEEQIHQAI